MNRTICRIPVVALLCTLVLVISGCNTVKGVGKDTEKAGEAIQRESDEHNRKHD